MEAAEGIAQDAVLPEAMAPPQQMRRDRNVNRLTLSDVIGSAEGPGGILFNWIPSRGDVERLRATSKAMRFAIDCAPQATVPQYRYLGLFRPSRGLEPLSALEPHQLGSLRHMAAAESPPGWRFGELRGGILADDPGLGKTVTMMALVVASAGATPRTPDEFWDRAAIREGWQSLRVNRVAKQQLTPLLNRIEGAGVVLPGGHTFLVDPAPLPTTFPTLESFEDDVWAAVNRVSSVEAMGALNDYARKALNAMRRGLDRKQRSYFATNVGRRALLERELRPVGATLIVVPTPLLEHWAEQFRRHVDLDAISRSPDGSGRLAVWIDGVGDLADLVPPSARRTARWLRRRRGARYVVVVTTLIDAAASLSARTRAPPRRGRGDPTRRGPPTTRAARPTWRSGGCGWWSTRATPLAAATSWTKPTSRRTPSSLSSPPSAGGFSRARRPSGAASATPSGRCTTCCASSASRRTG